MSGFLMFITEIADFFIDFWVDKITGRFSGRSSGKRQAGEKLNLKSFDKDTQKPVLKCSICNGEQVAGFKDIRTGKFEEVALIRSEKDLEDFKRAYGVLEITKEY